MPRGPHPPAQTLALWPETQALRLTRRPTCRPEQGEIFSTTPVRQDHVFARHNKFGSFQVKIEQKTGTRTKTQKTNTTKTKQKNDTKTEQKTMVADNIPTAGQRAVHFRILAIIGVAAACGLSVPASVVLAPRCMHYTLAHLLCTNSGLRPMMTQIHLHTLCFTAFHPSSTLGPSLSTTDRVACLPAPREPAPSAR